MTTPRRRLLQTMVATLPLAAALTAISRVIGRPRFLPWRPAQRPPHESPHPGPQVVPLREDRIGPGHHLAG